MDKLFAVVLVIIALASAYPVATHLYVVPEDISTHGHAIDDRWSDTVKEAGFAFLGAQLVLAFFVLKFAQRKEGAKVTNLPAGAKLVATVAFVIVGAEVFALGVLGQKARARVYFTPPRPDALQIQTQAGVYPSRPVRGVPRPRRTDGSSVSPAGVTILPSRGKGPGVPSELAFSGARAGLCRSCVSISRFLMAPFCFIQGPVRLSHQLTK